MNLGAGRSGASSRWGGRLEGGDGGLGVPSAAGLAEPVSAAAPTTSTGARSCSDSASQPVRTEFVVGWRPEYAPVSRSAR